MKKFLSVFLTFLLIISSISGALMSTVSAEGENLWKPISNDDIVRFEAPHLGLNDSSATSFSFWSPEYTYFCVKLPELEKDAGYNFSLKVRAYNADLSIVNLSVLNQSEFETAQNDTANYYSFPGSAKRMINSTTTFKANTSTAVTSCSIKADGSQYYLGFRCGGSANKNGTAYLYVENISLTKVTTYPVNVTGGTASVSEGKVGDTVTVSFTDTADKIFDKWDVVSRNVSLEDKNSATTTFTMPAGAVELSAIYKSNLWSSVVASDITSYTGYGSLYGYNNKQLRLASMPWQTVAIKMPTLDVNTTYELSMEYELSTSGSSTSYQHFAMVLFSETEYNNSTSDILNSKYTKQIVYSNSSTRFYR